MPSTSSPSSSSGFPWISSLTSSPGPRQVSTVTIEDRSLGPVEAPGGGRTRYPPASTRNVGAANLIAKHGVDILGTQELQADQLRALQSRTGMAAYPGGGLGAQLVDKRAASIGGR